MTDKNNLSGNCRTRNVTIVKVIKAFYTGNTVPSRQNCLITGDRAADPVKHPQVS